MIRSAILLILPVLMSVSAGAQDRFVVERIDVVDQTKPVYNIYVDENNVKWIANATTIYKLEAKDQATEVQIPSTEQSLLQLPGGDYDVRWNKQEIKNILGEALVTCAAYNQNKKELWIGTDGYGLFRLRVEGGLRLLEQKHIDNSKLRSDFINSIYITPNNKMWVGTQDGALLIENGNTKLTQKFFNIQTISGDRQETWAIGDGLVWIIDRKDNWIPYKIDPLKIESTMHDIAVDAEGRIWIASNIMTSYNIKNEVYRRFGPGQYFTSQFVNYVSVDDDGTIWVGTDDKGVYIIIKESTISVTTNVDNHLSCQSTVNDAQISARAVGGTPPYTFSWSHGAEGEVIGDLGPGVYQLTVTDQEGNTKAAEAEIRNPVMTVEVTQEQPESDHDMNDAVATVHVEGGVPDYNVVWSDGSTGMRLVEASEGDYSVTITDQAGCTATGQVTISRTLKPLAVNLQLTSEITCPGTKTAALQADITGGQGPYTIQWNDMSMTGETVSAIAAGSYSVTVTDAMGSTASSQVVVSQPDPITIDIAVQQSASVGGSDGIASVSVDGGSAPYDIAWSNDESGQNAEALSAGIHTVEVTDENGCMSTATVEITENILPLSVEVSQTTTISCAGAAEAALSTSVSGGKGPYSYAWNGSAATGPDPVNLQAGTYFLTVTDALGTTAVSEISIEEPEALSVSAEIESPASTNQSDGVAIASASGGTGNYTYAWSNGSSESEAVGLAPGAYVVTVSDEAGCTNTASVEITEDILPMSAQVVILEEITCSGTSTGILEATVRGGKGPFSYSWSDGNTSALNRDLNAGMHTVTVTDVTGATVAAASEISEPDPISVDIQIRASASTNQADGKARAKASGGNSGFTYQWDTGESSADAVSLTPGLHNITVTDKEGCTATATVEITEDILPLSVSIEQTSDVLCAGQNDAAISAEITGGKGPFTYMWDNGSSSSELSDIAAGNYALTVSDAVGNQAEASLTIIEPEPLTVEAIAVQAASTDGADGKARAKASGGNSGFTYQWDTGESSADAVLLTPGMHTVTVTDQEGCTAAATVEITEDILPLSVSVEQTSEALCAGQNDAVITAEITGGKGPFTYEWSNGGSSPELSDIAAGDYSLTVSDAIDNQAEASLTIVEPEPLTAQAVAVQAASTDGADGSAKASGQGGTGIYSYAWDNGEDESTATELTPGTHEVTVSDVNGCTAVATVEITENILPLELQATIVRPLQCAGGNDGAVSIEIAGGKAPFDEVWSDGSTERDREGLSAGTYILTVSDANGNSRTAEVILNDPAPLTVSVEVLQAASTHSADGQASAQAAGGIGEYTYSWDNGETGVRATELDPGTHSVTVTDANGCSATGTAEITENILPLSVDIVQSAPIACAGDVTGVLKAEVKGGKSPFAFTWSNGRSDQSNKGLAAGTYSVTVSDVTGQSDTADYEIIAPEPLSAEVVNVRSAAAEHVPDGKATVEVTGGTAPYTFAWDSGETEARATRLSIGTHEVMVTDANGCSVSKVVEITKKILPELTAETLQSGEAVRMEQLQFEADSSNINEESVPTLDELYAFLYDNPTIVVEIGGHTNGLPAHDYCDRLSTARAKAVAEYIVQKGIDEKRVYYKGYGKRRPIATNRTPSGRKKNQRVEVRILRLEDLEQN